MKRPFPRAALLLLVFVLAVVAAQAQERTIEVQGQVVEKKTGKPLAAITVTGLKSAEGETAVTDAEGRFSKRITAARHVWILIDTAPFLRFGRIIEIPAGAETVDAGRLELERGVLVSGVVRDQLIDSVSEILGVLVGALVGFLGGRGVARAEGNGASE